jgi:hypothetical protein
MPAVSEKQRRLMAMALYNPDKIYKKNRGVLKMSAGQLHDFVKKKKKRLHQGKGG